MDARGGKELSYTSFECGNEGASVSNCLLNPVRYDQCILHQAGEKLLFNGSYTIASGNYFEIGTLLFKSEEVLFQYGERCQVHDLLFLFPNTRVNLDVRGKAKYGFVKLSLKRTEDIQAFSALHQTNSFSVTIHNSHHICNGEILTRLLYETMEQNAYSHLLVGSYLNQLLVTVSRSIMQVNQEEEPKKEGVSSQRISARNEIVRQALTYIDNQYLELRDMREVAQRIGYSYSYVAQVFKEEMGISLQAYYTNKKLKKAMQMLAQKHKSVTQVAELLQYQSIHSFSKAFKKLTGLTPTEFQQQYEQSKILV